MLKSIFKMQWNSIRAKISVIFIFVITALMISSGTVLYFIFSDILQKQIIHDLDQVMLQNKINIDNLMNSVDQATMLLYADTTIADVLQSPVSSAVEINRSTTTVNNQLIKYIYIPLSKTLTSYTATFFLSDETALAASISSMSGFDYGVYNNHAVISQEWYKNTIKHDGAMYCFTIEGDKRHIYMSRLIKNQSFNQPGIGISAIKDFGIVVIGFDVSQLERQLSDVKLTPSSIILLGDEKGQVIYDSDTGTPVNNLKQYPFTAADGGGKSNNNYVASYNNHRYIINIKALEYGWNLVSMISMSDVYGRISIIRYTILLTTILSILVGTLLVTYISGSISKPIKILATVMKGIRNKYSTDISLESPSKDEVGTLYESFNDMMIRINDLISEVYKSGLREKDSELKALQAQINPHFLYNTLDSVNWMALGAGLDDITIMISSLSSILRYSIKNANQFVSISEEIDQVKNYINIQKIRYNNQFYTDFSFEPEIMQCKIPKLILQPLVENALIHGLEKSGRRGCITLSGVISGSNILLSVSDNGAGTDVEQLNAYLEGIETSVHNSDGYGIKNVNSRIKLRFGNSYGLRYEANSNGEGITAVISLPLDDTMC